MSSTTLPKISVAPSVPSCSINNTPHCALQSQTLQILITCITLCSNIHINIRGKRKGKKWEESYRENFFLAHEQTADKLDVKVHTHKIYGVEKKIFNNAKLMVKKFFSCFTALITKK